MFDKMAWQLFDGRIASLTQQQGGEEGALANKARRDRKRGDDGP